MKRKSEFLSELDARNIDGDTDMLLAPLSYYSKILGRVITAPKGFVTDYESIPRWLPLIYAWAKGKAKKAACIHDLLYQHHEVGKRKADLVFYEAMGAQKVPVNLALREIMYAAVIIGGWTAYASGPDRFKVLQKQN